MGTQKMSGLTKRGGTWHIDKVFRGTRIRESTGTGEIVKAQELLAKRIEEIRAAQLYGVRPDRTFRAAATKFLNENQHKGVSRTMRFTCPNSIPSSGTCFSSKCIWTACSPSSPAGERMASRRRRSTWRWAR